MMGDPNQEAEADDVYAQILGEIGMSMQSDMATGTDAIGAPQAAAVNNAQDDDLQSRLNALKGG